MTIYTRKARSTDMDAIMKILEEGIAYLRDQGLPQWQNGQGPNGETVQADIINGYAYVLVDDQNVVGYGVLVPGPDHAYENINQGSWQYSSKNYVAIHRIAVDRNVRGKGLAKILIHDLIVLARNLEYLDIRIDTYPENVIMEKVIFSAGFCYRGMIHFGFADGERKAYQLVLE
ncbi:L-amino acid N-acyltransferase YncA [Gracilibacillus ureilyticus]|uniref:L-amino acid N-acyltransferase YncA n=1 Tax=Gracilibacillus ureilyticus TaxID=531814 RepID=A0A1H9VW33_9BACI|nr:GNAT family N-acetyltransferase [Gracilibacillus ureilyticus]SES25719.1 L-amino acid N-acyltransferase YncA [Gracilibacillus ureilyticus]